MPETQIANTPENVLTAKLERLAELKKFEAEFSPIKTEIEQLRLDIQDIMRQTSSKRSDPVAGYFAVREERKSIVINDEDALNDWLEENVMSPEDYRKIDVSAIRALAEERLRDYGELLPGVDQVVTETISIRTAKK